MSSDEILAAKAAFDVRGMTSHELGAWPAFRDGYAAGLAARKPGPEVATASNQPVICIGLHTFARLLRCQMVEVNGAYLIPADDFKDAAAHAEAMQPTIANEAAARPRDAGARLLIDLAEAGFRGAIVDRFAAVVAEHEAAAGKDNPHAK